jgi:hypothetical protein
MQVSIATEPISATSPNLDWAGSGERVAVVLDGLTEGGATGCIHGTAWYVDKLGSRLLAHAGSGGEIPLGDSLSLAIDEVAALHRDTCDLAHPGTPCTTVTMIRQRGKFTDYLVLADSPLVLDLESGPMVVIDEAEKAVSARIGRDFGDPEGLAKFIQVQQKQRNIPGGYWVAQADPAAGQNSLCGTVESARGAALASDGAALLVTDFGQMTWEQYLFLGYAEGPQAIVKATRRAEASDPGRLRWPRHKVSDDATVAICRF